MATPWSAPRPAAPNAHAATPSRGPQPPMFVGTAIASSTSIANGSSAHRRNRRTDGPGGDHERRRVARTTTTDASTTPTQARRASSPARRSARGAPGPGPARGRGRAGSESARPPQPDAQRSPARPASTPAPATGRRTARSARAPACTICPATRSQPTARSPRPTSPASPTVLEPAVHVAQHAAGQRGVEELRSVVGGDRGAQRHDDAEPTRNQPPPPGRAHGGHDGDSRGRDQRPAADHPESVQKGPVPSRQTTTARIAPPPSRRAQAHTARSSGRRPPRSCRSTIPGGPADARAGVGQPSHRQVRVSPSIGFIGSPAATNGAALWRSGPWSWPSRTTWFGAPRAAARSRSRSSASRSQRSSAMLRAPASSAGRAGPGVGRPACDRAPPAPHRPPSRCTGSAAGQGLGDHHAVGLGARREHQQVRGGVGAVQLGAVERAGERGPDRRCRPPRPAAVAGRRMRDRDPASRHRRSARAGRRSAQARRPARRGPCAASTAATHSSPPAGRARAIGGRTGARARHVHAFRGNAYGSSSRSRVHQLVAMTARAAESTAIPGLARR